MANAKLRVVYQNKVKIPILLAKDIDDRTYAFASNDSAIDFHDFSYNDGLLECKTVRLPISVIQNGTPLNFSRYVQMHYRIISSRADLEVYKQFIDKCNEITNTRIKSMAEDFERKKLRQMYDRKADRPYNDINDKHFSDNVNKAYYADRYNMRFK